jgi:hypothetical protein
MNDGFSQSCKRTPTVIDGRFKSYATEANLLRALERLHIHDHFHLRCLTTEGKWTAIFPYSNFDGGYIALYSQHGFMTLG